METSKGLFKNQYGAIALLWLRMSSGLQSIIKQKLKA